MELQRNIVCSCSGILYAVAVEISRQLQRNMACNCSSIEYGIAVKASMEMRAKSSMEMQWNMA